MDAQLVLDNRINVSHEHTKMVVVSGVQNNVFEINPEGSGFASNIIFQNVITPSLSNTLVSRNMRIRYLVSISAAADPGCLKPFAALGANGATCVLRAFPLQSVCDNITLTINGASTTLNSRVCIPATQRRLPAEWVRRESTECPSMADNSACLSADALGVALTTQQPTSAFYNSDGTTRASFLASYYNAGTHVFQFEVSESIMVSPLTCFSEETFLANINTLSIQFNYSQLTDMFVQALAANVPAGTSVAISNPRLELTYIQVANELVSIPRMVSYPYENLVYFNKQVATMNNTNAADQPYSVQSDTIRLQSMPSLLYIFMRPQISQRTSVPGQASQADAFLALGSYPALNGGLMPSLSITLGNRTGLLASASCKTLYRMSVRNGYRGTYQDWQYGSGSLLIIDPVQDLGINLQAGDILPGESGSVNFQFQATYNNANYVASTVQTGGANIAGLALELVIVPVYSGVVSITPDNCVFNLGELSEGEVNTLLRTAPKEGQMISTETIKPTINGGSLFSKFKSVLGHGARALTAIASHPITKSLAGGRMRRGGVLSTA